MVFLCLFLGFMLTVVIHLYCNTFSGVQKRVLTEISSDIFFSNTTASSSSSSRSSSVVKSVADDKASRQNDSESDCDDLHGI